MKRFIRKHRRFFITTGFVLILALVVSAAVLQYSRPLPEVSLAESEPLLWPGHEAKDIAWPNMGQASMAIMGAGIIDDSPDQAAQPIASLAKVMTAHIILKHHPLETGQPGPDIEFSTSHVQNYRIREANQESVVRVASGSTMTQRELLRGLLIASGNNIADVLAEWHAGSVEAFVAQMNAEAEALGMTSTHYADAAGLSPESRSTAHDQMLLALEAMRDPTFAAIVRELDADLPGAGMVYNTNWTLGQSGIVGVKTGWTEEAGACFLFAAEWQVEDRQIMVVGAVLGQNTLEDAFARSRELIAIGGSSARMVKVGSEGQVVGVLKSGWGDTADAVLTEDARLLVLPGSTINATLRLDKQLDKAAEIQDGVEVGSIRFESGGESVEVPVMAGTALGQPDLMWRLLRIR